MFFYWQKSILSRWSPVKSPDSPVTKHVHGGFAGEIKGLVTLPPDEVADDLDVLAARYPIKDDPPAAVTVEPPSPAPQSGDAEALEPPRKTLVELAQEIASAKDQLFHRLIKHIKSGGEYEVTGVHFRESDMVLSIEYTPYGLCHHEVYFSRPLPEVLDGRFEILDRERV